ncbi:unnamed protein product [Sphagnum troendelagicum]|uniref:RRM domain-containing protein n=1 Tax=Sphagnum troendelagicum TaxID=128251 RepID=A0ABP0UBA1_9BRYO
MNSIALAVVRGFGFPNVKLLQQDLPFFQVSKQGTSASAPILTETIKRTSKESALRHTSSFMGGKIVAVGDVQQLPPTPSPSVSSSEAAFAAAAANEGLAKVVQHRTSLDPERGMEGVLASNNNSVSINELSNRYGASPVTTTTTTSLEGGLEGMSLNSGDYRDSAPEGIAVTHHQQTSVNDPVVSGGLFTYSSSEMVEREYISPQQLVGQVDEYNNTTTTQQSLRGIGGGYDSQRSHEHRPQPPPTILLPEQTMVDKEFGVLQHQADQSDAEAHHAYGLPAYLVVSPSCHDGKQMVLDHNGKQVLLDPNAREYTPSQSLCASPVLPPGLLHMAVPTPYHIEQPHLYTQGVDVGQPASRMVYGPDYSGGSMFPLYCNGGAVGFAPVTGPQSPTTWEHLAVPDLMQHQSSQGSPSGILTPAPAIGLGQPVHSHHLPYATIQPFMSVGCPTMAASGSSLIAHPALTGREHVSRALLLNGVPIDMDEHQLKKEMEEWGPVRALGMERQHEGLVTVHYYDLRHTKEALGDIQQQHLWHQQRMQRRFQRQRSGGPHLHGESGYDRQDRGKHADRALDEAACDLGLATTRGLIAGKVMWAQYTSPSGAFAGPDALNQGTLVVFNLDADMPLDKLKAVFEEYGTVKELRETPAKKLHKFVEFYDVRDAAKALKSLDNQEIGGKRVKIEISRPGGQAYKARVAQQAQVQQEQSAPLFAGTSSRSSKACTAAGGVPGPMYVSWNADSAGSPNQAINSQHTGPPYLWTGYGSITGDFGRENNPHSGQRRGDGFSSRRKRIASMNGNGGSYGRFELMQQCQSGKMASRDGSGTGKPSLPMKSSSSQSVLSQYIFDEGDQQSNESPRTTLMIKNIPNKYSQAMLLQLLDRHCLHSNSNLEDPNEPPSAYDFVYLPIDFKNRCNLGYAFVNFTSVEATRRLYKAFHAQQWEAFNSRKICQVTYARVQGRAALEEHFRNSRFACDNDEYLPLCFSPPRNGTTPSPPTVAAGHSVGCAVGSSSSHEDQGSGWMTRDGDVRERAGDENTKRVPSNGINHNHEQEMEQAGVHGRVLGGNRTNGPQHHR